MTLHKPTLILVLAVCAGTTLFSLWFAWWWIGHLFRWALGY